MVGPLDKETHNVQARFKIALCSGLAGLALFAGSAQALTAQECGALESNQFLAAVERGTCRIDIETAAGPDYIYLTENGGGEDGNDNRRGGEHGGHHDDSGNGGDDGGNGGNPNGGARAAAKP